jgi:hypothetical protein
MYVLRPKDLLFSSSPSAHSTPGLPSALSTPGLLKKMVDVKLRTG